MHAIIFESVSKSFSLNSQRMLARGYLSGLLSGVKKERFHALKNISFRIAAGEAIGVVGANGAGKSTLLSMVAGLCPPDSGWVQVNGRVAALLQLGAGFHPDLTGVENVYMNAALMGLSARHTARVFDQIVEFAGVGQFVNEPLRTYSSGMTMRLGFSIAVHSDPDIFIIDEVLAVGDKDFQAKCGEKILEFKERGKTLLFVSHAASSVQQLCNRAIWLDRGEVMMDGAASEVLAAYEGQLQYHVPASGA